MGRAPCCDKANVKRGPWSPEEDTKLKEYIEKHGTGGNWIALPQKAGLKRCGKSCRLRWLNYLRPNIKHGEFSDEEDRIICSLYANIGSRWSIIAAQLPGRTDNDIKNYWNTKLKKKLMALLPAPTITHNHHQRKLPPYHHQLSSSSSSPQNPPLIPSDHSLSSSPYTHHHYYTSYYNTTPPPTISFSGLEPVSVHSDTYTNTCCTTTPPNNNISLPDDFYQNEEQLIMSTVTTNPSSMQLQYYFPTVRDSHNTNNLFMFGSEGSCSSSDGSCSQVSHGCRENIINNNNNIKQEQEQELAFQNYMSSPTTTKFEEYNSSNNNNNSLGGEYGINQWTATAMDYELEVIKQLISSNSNIGNNSNNDGYLLSSVDENKTAGEKMGTSNYYYY